MTSSTKILNRLQKATNYTKLALHKDGPHSYKKGQGALLKVLYKFGDGKLSKKKLKEILSWSDPEMVEVVKKADKNGYVTVDGDEHKFTAKLTKKGRKIVDKRLKAEDRAADEILSDLSKKERECLYRVSQKLIDTCKEMGVDYSLIKKKPIPIQHTDAWHEAHRHEHEHMHPHERPRPDGRPPLRPVGPKDAPAGPAPTPEDFPPPSPEDLVTELPNGGIYIHYHVHGPAN